jgi:hypothetical protein
MDNRSLSEEEVRIVVRTLTDGDVKAIVDELERRATQRFQLNIGKGVLSLVWKSLFYLILWLAAYGAAGGFRKFFN